MGYSKVYYMLNERYFKVNECVFPYLKHSYNDASNNERTVEIRLGEFFINNFGYGITEIGNIMGPYDFPCGDSISVKECLDRNLNNKNVLAVGVTESSIELINKITSEANNYLITVAIGHYKILDNYLEKNNFLKFTMKRITGNNLWVKEEKPNFNHSYNSPFPYANGICCVTNLESLL